MKLSEIVKEPYPKSLDEILPNGRCCNYSTAMAMWVIQKFFHPMQSYPTRIEEAI